MRILERIKAAFTTDKPSRYEAASSATLIGRDYVPPPFNYHQAVIECRSWVYAAARLNAVAVASAPLRLYVKNRSAGTKLWNTRRTGRRTKAYLSGDLAQLPSRYAMQKAAEYGDDYEIVTDAHPLLTLLAKVNPYQNGFDAAVLRVLYTELTGNAYLHPVIDPALGVPVELWTMPPQWMKIVPGNPLRGEPWIKGYEYGRNDAQRQDFAPDEVIHFKQPNPRDLYYGLGKVESAWGAVTSNQALHEMDYHFFANKSRPDYLLVTQGNASDEELERFTAQVETKLRGTNKTGRFLAITGQVDLKPLQFPPKDLQGREEIVEEIAAVFGVPVSMLRANDPNLASATVGFATWKETTILPMLRMDEEVLNQNLLPLFGIEEDAFLAYDNPVRADESLETTKRLSYVAGGILTINEARMQEGLDPLPAPLADQPLINGQPLGGPPPAPPSPFGGIFGNAAPAIKPRKSASQKSCGCGCAPGARVKQSDFLGKHAPQPLSAWLKVKNAEKEGDRINESEAKMSAAVSRVFDAQVKELLETLAAAGTMTPALADRTERLLRSRNYQRALVDALAPYLRDAIAVGVDLGIDTVSKVATTIDFEVEREDLRRYADSESMRLARRTAQGVTEYTAVRVREVLGDGLAQGETVDELAGRVQSWAESQKDEDGTWSRARTVARTEANRAARVAETEAWSATGLVQGKTWLLAPDPCEFCEAASKAFSKNAVGLNQPFYAKGEVLTGADGGAMVLDYEDVQGPPLHPNCRCSMQPKLSDELEADIREIEESGELEAAARQIMLEEGNR